MTVPTKIAFIILRFNPCSHQGVLSALFRIVSWGNCVAFVSLVLVAIVVRGMRVGCSHFKGPLQILTFSFCFGYVLLNGVFLFFFFWGGGGDWRGA